MRNLILHERPWQKFNNREESNCSHTQHRVLILSLQITIRFDPWLISCAEEISKILKAVKVGLAEFFPSKTRDWYHCGIIILAERLPKTIESYGLYFAEYISFQKIFLIKCCLKNDITYETVSCISLLWLWINFKTHFVIFTLLWDRILKSVLRFNH